MADIIYVEGDATQPQADGVKIIVHVCNDLGRWGKGFVMAISNRWPEPEARFRKWHAGDGDEPFELGQVQFVSVAQDLWVANLIGQEGLTAKKGVKPVRYEAIEQGLETTASFALDQNASVHMPRIGCGLAGGTWDRIERIINKSLVRPGVSVTVYDFKK